MNYVVMDLEWNQSTNDENVVRNLPFEIIEIGAVKLDDKREIVGEFKQLIRPQVYKEMHFVTQNLIHLRSEELREGRLFADVAKDFLNWCGEEFMFCTWGPLDLAELQRNMAYYQVEPISKAPAKFYDVQKLFSIAYEDSKLRRTLEYAVDYLKIEKDVPFHRAYSDAYYTARVMQKMELRILCNYSFHIFGLPQNRKEEIKVVFDTYNKHITRGFEDKTAILNDRDIMSTRCYYCGKNSKRKIKWFTPNGKHYYSIACCGEHGYMKTKVRIRRTDDGIVYAVKTCRPVTEDEVAVIWERQQRAKRQKKLQNKNKYS